MQTLGGATTMLVDRNPKTLRQLTLEKFRTAILELKFQPGERLVERKLCELLGVSRSVVREVLRNLESEGLVVIVPGQGPAVSKPEPSEIEEIYELRLILESMAARHCAERISPKEIKTLGETLKKIKDGYAARNPTAVLRATTDFYEIIFRTAKRSVAWTVVTALNGRISHLRATTIATEGRDKAGVAEIQDIYDAIIAHDGGAAEAASVTHVRNAMHLALKHFSMQD